MIKGTYARMDSGRSVPVSVHGFKDDTELIRYFTKISPVRFFETEFDPAGYILKRHVILHDGLRVEIEEDDLYEKIIAHIESKASEIFNPFIPENIYVNIHQHESTATFIIELSVAERNGGKGLIEAVSNFNQKLLFDTTLKGVAFAPRNIASTLLPNETLVYKIYGEILHE